MSRYRVTGLSDNGVSGWCYTCVYYSWYVECICIGTRCTTIRYRVYRYSGYECVIYRCTDNSEYDGTCVQHSVHSDGIV